MTEDRLPLAELLAKAGDGDFLRSVAEAVVQLLMETDVEGVIGADAAALPPRPAGQHRRGPPGSAEALIRVLPSRPESESLARPSIRVIRSESFDPSLSRARLHTAASSWPDGPARAVELGS